MRRDSKIILSIILGGLLIITILLLTISILTDGSISLNINPNGDTVAIIPLHGEITYGSIGIIGGSVITPEIIKKAITKAETDNSICSILLDVNSPGGSPVASEEIMDMIKECKKPVVVWISDVGASGAYLAASSADKIVASPSSMVGSIGVIMELTDLSQYYQMNGVHKYSIKAGQYKDMGADYRSLTPDENKMLQGLVDQDYNHFITIVSNNRHLDKNYTRSIAEGKIYTGIQAKELKLVDDIGGKSHALDIAAKLGGIKGNYNIITISTSGLLDLFNSLSSKIAYSIGLGIGNNLKNNTNNNIDMPMIY